jgi:glycosyltransferase involved in cell wall biosynthesis
MLILQVCADSGIEPGGSKGASAHLHHIAVACLRRGHRVVTASKRPPSNLNPHPVPVTNLSLGLRRIVIDHGPPDLIYERYSLGHLAGLELARRLGVPFLLEVNAPLVDEARRHRPLSVRRSDQEVERLLFAEADLILAVSSPLAAYVSRVRGSLEGVIVAQNGVDPAHFPEAAAHRSPPVIAFLGHPKPWHGADRLPQLLAPLIRRDREIRVKLIGGGEGATSVLSAAHRLGVGYAFESTGPVAIPEIAGHLQGAAVGIAPYPYTDFFYFSPLKVVEYMAAGLPVVASDLGDIKATVGEGGIVVDAGDDDGLRRAVSDLADNPELRRRLGSRGRERALSEFTWDRIAERIDWETALLMAGRT